ncbi:MAG: hypothetical protein IJ749_07210 [Eubacterium sp.]|nr:hypothetical protein [Eubacterium sp.]
MPNYRPNIVITVQDIEELSYRINESYKVKGKDVIDVEKLLPKLQKKSPQELYSIFMDYVNNYPYAWEYIDFHRDYDLSNDVEGARFEQTAKDVLPLEMRNTGDATRIENYLVEKQTTLSVQAKAILLKRLEAIDKSQEIYNKANQRADGRDPFSKRPKVDCNKDGTKFKIKIDMPKYQTSGNGCWSTGTQMLLQSRGITNVTQEDIRAFRPNYSQGALNGWKFKEKHNIDLAYNTDGMQNVMDMGDNALAFAPDAMLKTLDIVKITDAETALGKKFTPAEKEAYRRSAIALVKKTIYKAIVEEASPVTVSDGAHYITIVGMDGDELLYQTSTNAPANREERMPIGSFVSKILNGKNKLQFVWMADIELAQDMTHFYNVPSNYVSLNEDGTLNKPPVDVQEDNDSMKSQQEYNGFRVRLYSGKEDAGSDRLYRDIMSDGVIKIEQAYFPKRVNAANLRRRAQERKPKDEQILRERSIALLGYDPTNRPVPKQKKQSKEETITTNLKLQLDEGDNKPKYRDDTLEFSGSTREKRQKDNFIRLKDRAITNANETINRRKEQIIERNAMVQASMGKGSNFYAPDVDRFGKELIWNKEGAVTLFRLQMAYEAIIPILNTLGKTKAVGEITARYNELMHRLNSPENAITPEEGATLNGFDGEGVMLPNGQKMTHYFKKAEDIYEATMLLDTISNTVSLKLDLNQTKRGTKGYSPSPISRGVELVQEMADYSRGNFLKACMKNPALCNYLNQVSKLPSDNYGVLTTKYANATNNMQLYMQLNVSAVELLRAQYNIQDMDNNLIYSSAYEIKNVSDTLIKFDRKIESCLNATQKNKNPLPLVNELVVDRGYIAGEKMALQYGWTLAECGIGGFIGAIDAQIKQMEASGQVVNPELKNDFNLIYQTTWNKRMDVNNAAAKGDIVTSLYALCEKYKNDPALSYVNAHRYALQFACGQYVDIANFRLVEEQPHVEEQPNIEEQEGMNLNQAGIADSNMINIEDDEEVPLKQDNELQSPPKLEQEEVLPPFIANAGQPSNPNQTFVDDETEKRYQEALEELNKSFEMDKQAENLEISEEDLEKEFQEELKNVALEEGEPKVETTKAEEEPNVEKFIDEDEINNMEYNELHRQADYDKVIRDYFVFNASQIMTDMKPTGIFGDTDITLDQRRLALDDPADYSDINLAFDRGGYHPGYGKMVTPNARQTGTNIHEVLDRDAYNRLKANVKSSVDDFEDVLINKRNNHEINDEEYEYYYNAVTAPMNRILRGYHNQYINTRMPLAGILEAPLAYINTQLQGEKRLGDRIIKSREMYPIYDLRNNSEKLINTYANYLEDKDKSKLTPDKEELYRKSIYSQTVRLLNMLDIMDNSIYDPVISPTLRALNFIDTSNNPQDLGTLEARGLGGVKACLKGMKVGLEKGWTMEDIGVLSQFYIMYAALTKDAAKKVQLGKKEDLYSSPEQELIAGKMASLITEIEKTTLTDYDRNRFMNQMKSIAMQCQENQLLRYESKYFKDLCITFKDRDKLIAQEKESAISPMVPAEVVNETNPMDVMALAICDFNSSKSIFFFGSETAEHKNLREALDRLRSSYSKMNDLAGEQLETIEFENYFNSLDETIYYSKQYQSEKSRRPSTEGGKDRLRGAQAIEQYSRELMNTLVTRYNLEHPNDKKTVEQFRLKIAENRKIRAESNISTMTAIPRDAAGKAKLMDQAADIMIFKLANSNSPASIKAFNNMGFNNLKNEIKNSSEFKSIMKSYLSDRTITPERLKQELSGDAAINRMRNMSRKMTQESDKLSAKTNRSMEDFKRRGGIKDKPANHPAGMNKK